jgi:hypothetical protein
MGRWTTVGFVVWAIAVAAWTIVGMTGQVDGLTTFGFALGTLGLAWAAFASASDAPRRLLPGVALALLGVVPFYMGQFGASPTMNGYFFAILCYMGGLALVLVAAILGARDVGSDVGRAWMLRAGAFVAAVAGAFWIPLDGWDSPWQTGNVLEFVGALMVALFHRP